MFCSSIKDFIWLSPLEGLRAFQSCWLTLVYLFLTPLCPAHRWVWLSGVLHLESEKNSVLPTLESNYIKTKIIQKKVRHFFSNLKSKSQTPQSTVTFSLQSQQCLAYWGVRIPGVLHTPEFDSAVSCSPKCLTPRFHPCTLQTVQSLNMRCPAHCGVF